MYLLPTWVRKITLPTFWLNAPVVIRAKVKKAILMSLPRYLTRYLTQVVVWKVSPPNPRLAVSVSRIVVFQLFVDILVAPMSAAGFWHLRHLAGCQSMVKLEESLPSILAVRELSSSPNLARVSSTLCLNWLPPCAKWQEQLEVLSQRDSDPTPCCERAGVIVSQRDALPPNIWFLFSFSNSKFTNIRLFVGALDFRQLLFIIINNLLIILLMWMCIGAWHYSLRLRYTYLLLPVPMWQSRIEIEYAYF